MTDIRIFPKTRFEPSFIRGVRHKELDAAEQEARFQHFRKNEAERIAKAIERVRGEK